MIAALLFGILVHAPAAEADPYFVWRVEPPPRDSAAAVDRVVNATFVGALQNVGRRASCREAAGAMTAPLSATALYYFAGPVRSWRIDVVPRRGSERERAEHDRWSVYRDAPLFPFGHAVPLDPTMNVDGVFFGTDKLAHFFTNGLRAYDTYRAVLEAGGDEAAALRAAIMLGVEEESGWLGAGVCGIFSYGDIHANISGLRFYAALCDGGELALEDGAWRLTAPFRIARFVTPCWDESFAPSAFAPREQAALRAALAEVCPQLATERVQAWRAAYRRRGCAVDVTGELHALIEHGVAPDPSPWSIESVCAAAPAAAAPR